MRYPPQHRQVLYEIFMKNYRVRRNVIQTRLTQELGDQTTKADMDRLLKVRQASEQSVEQTAEQYLELALEWSVNQL